MIDIYSFDITCFDRSTTEIKLELYQTLRLNDIKHFFSDAGLIIKYMI